MMSSRPKPLAALALVVLFVLVTGGCSKSSGLAVSTTTTTTANGHGAAPGSGPKSTAPATTTPPDTSPTPKKILKLADHPLFADQNVGLPNTPCKLPRWSPQKAQIRNYFRAVTRCLNTSWSQILHADNLPFTPPRLYFPTGKSFSSDCGTIKVGIGTAAYYCEGELFLPWRGLQLSQYADKPAVYVALIAHEYGHHVQELAGVMDAVWNYIYAKKEHSPAGELMSRRKELQAQCFSGMFMGSQVGYGGSITKDMYKTAWSDQATRGDDTSGGHDHGTNADYAMWWRRGALGNRLAQCNTFKAPKSELK